MTEVAFKNFGSRIYKTVTPVRLFSTKSVPNVYGILYITNKLNHLFLYKCCIFVCTKSKITQVTVGKLLIIRM